MNFRSEPVGLSLIAPQTRITTVFRGGGRLATGRPVIPETDVRLLNWTVSSQVSISNVNANGGEPPPGRGVWGRPPRQTGRRSTGRVYRDLPRHDGKTRGRCHPDERASLSYPGMHRGSSRPVPGTPLDKYPTIYILF